MNTQALQALGQNAQAYARCYVSVKEALVHEGVKEAEAAEAAQYAAFSAAMWEGEERPPWLEAGGE